MRSYNCSKCHVFYFSFGNLWNNKVYCNNCIGLIKFKSFFNYPRIFKTSDNFNMIKLKQSLKEVQKEPQK